MDTNVKQVELDKIYLNYLLKLWNSIREGISLLNKHENLTSRLLLFFLIYLLFVLSSRNFMKNEAENKGDFQHYLSVFVDYFIYCSYTVTG